MSDAALSDLEQKIASVSDWRHSMELAPGIFTPGKRNPQAKLKALKLPERMDGMRVLDIGASDGFYSFECERRGAAEIVAMDVREPRGFRIAADALGSKVQYHKGSLYELDLGQFDLVLCLNVLYHLKDIYGAVERLRTYCRGQLIGCTWAIDNGFVMQDDTKVPLAELAPAMADQPIVQLISGVPAYQKVPSYWVVSKAAMRTMLEKSGFTVDELLLTGHSRVYFWAH